MSSELCHFICLQPCQTQTCRSQHGPRSHTVSSSPLNKHEVCSLAHSPGLLKSFQWSIYDVCCPLSVLLHNAGANAMVIAAATLRDIFLFISWYLMISYSYLFAQEMHSRVAYIHAAQRLICYPSIFKAEYVLQQVWYHPCSILCRAAE